MLYEVFSKIFCENLAKETSDFYIETKSKKAKIIAKQNGVIAGLDFCKAAFKIIGSEAIFLSKVKDGSRVKKNKVIAEEDSIGGGMCTCISPRPKSDYRIEFESILGDDAWDNLDMDG